MDLNYFVGKPCTIATVAINFRYNVEPMMEHFMGVIEKVDDDGILLISPHSQCKSFIFLKHVVSVSEEPVLYEDNPEHKKIIDEYRQKNPITAVKTKIPPAPAQLPVVPPPPPPKYLDPRSMAKLAKKGKEVFGKTTPAVTSS